MAKIIAIANQKGGVGKTTTVVNIAAGLAELGKKVLCIDLDPQATLAPQGNLSDYLGYDFTGKRTIVDVLKETAKLSECILTAKNEPIDYVPADISLATADMFLAQTMCREQILDKAISGDSILEDYDYLLIDCLPSLGILVMNVLAAADEVIIPVQVQKFALNGIVQFEDIFNLIREKINHDLKICGILETMTDNTQMAQAVDIALKERYGGLVYETTISKRIEAVSLAQHETFCLKKQVIFCAKLAAQQNSVR